MWSCGVLFTEAGFCPRWSVWNLTCFTPQEWDRTTNFRFTVTATVQICTRRDFRTSEPSKIKQAKQIPIHTVWINVWSVTFNRYKVSSLYVHGTRNCWRDLLVSPEKWLREFSDWFCLFCSVLKKKCYSMFILFMHTYLTRIIYCCNSVKKSVCYVCYGIDTTI